MAIRKDVVQLSIEINGVKAGQTYKELRNNARDLTRELDKLEPGTDAFIKKTAELKGVNNVLATIRKTSGGVAHGMEDAGKKAFSLTNILKAGALAAVAFFSVQRIQEWGKQFIGFLTKGTAALEAMQRKTRIVFGDAIDIVEDYAAINAQSLGVTEEKYASLAASIADILIPMKFQRDRAAEISVQLVNIAGALSAWDTKQRSSEEITSILTKALTGERESLKELGIVISEADVQARLLADGNSKLTGTALQQAKAQATLNLIMEKSVDAQRAFATGQDSIGRTGSRLNAFFSQIKENLLNKFLPAVKAIGGAFADLVAPVKERSDIVFELQSQFNLEIETLKRGDLSYENRKRLIEEINTKYREYLPNLITETTSYAELTKIQREANAAFAQRIINLATEEELSKAFQKRIALEKEARDLQLAYSAAEGKLNLELLEQGSKIDRASRKFIQDETFTRAFERQSVQRRATAAAELEEQIAINKKAQQEALDNYEKTLDAAKALGLDINKILNPSTPDALADPTAPAGKKSAAQLEFEKLSELINQERELRHKANLATEQSEKEFAANRVIIDLKATNKIAQARIRIFSQAKLDEERLTASEIENLKNEVTQNDLEIIKQQNEVSLALSIDLINNIAFEKEKAARQEIKDQEDLAHELELIRLNAEESILITKLNHKDKLDDEYTDLEKQLSAKRGEIDKVTEANSFRLFKEGLERNELEAILALRELELLEEDFNKAKEVINLETIIRITEEEVKQYAKGTNERLRLEEKLAAAKAKLNGITFNVPDTGGGTSEPGEGESFLGLEGESLEKFLKAKAYVTDQTQIVADTILQINRNRIDEELRLELDSIDRLAEARLAAAGDDAVLKKKINAEANRDREKAEKEAARERKAIALKEAIIQGALGVIKAIPNIAVMVAAGIAAAAQITTIESQTFAKGGFTAKKGFYRDKTGHEVAGVVHANEYVAAPWMLQDPRTAPAISYLERIRQARGGYAEGGFTTVSTAPSTFNQASVSTSAMEEKLDTMIALLQNVDMNVEAWPRKVQAVVSYRGLEDFRSEVDYIKTQANA